MSRRTPYNIIIDQGASFSNTVQIKDADGDGFDLTGYTVRGQIRRNYNSGSAAATFVTDLFDAENGYFEFSLTPLQTTGLKAGCYVYDIEIESGSGTVDRVLEGQATVTPEVTRD